VTETRNDFTLEVPIPTASLESILCTEELQRRPSRPPDYEKENCALVKLVSALADSPSTIFHTLAGTILDITNCDSAGLSLLTKDGKTPHVDGQRFYWPAICGMWNPHVGGGTPRNFGPCGDVLDQNRTLLFTHFERRYPYLLPVSPAAEECLLVPFYVDAKAVGTIWGIMHSNRRKFDAEDDRVMASLGKFASSAYQAWMHIEELKIQVAEREKAEAEVRQLASGLEAKIRRLVEANVVGMVMWNLEGAITGANEAFLQMVQYDREDLASGRVRWRDLTPPEWRDRDERAIAELKASGVFPPFEKEYFRKDGSRVPILLGGALFEESGNEGVAFILDLSEQKQAEQRYRVMVETASDAVVCMDENGAILLANPATMRVFGYAPAELIGKPLTVLMPEYLRKLHEHGFRRYLATGQRHINWQGTELTGLRNNGQEFPVEISFGEVTADGHRIFTGFIRDISERKRTEEALRRSEEKWRAVFENSAIGVCLADLNGRFMAANSAHQKMVGYSEEELRSLTFLELTHENYRQSNWKQIEELKEGTKTQFQIEKQLIRKDGSLIWVTNNVSLVPGSEVMPQFIMALSEDITERKRAEAEIRALKDQLYRENLALRDEIDRASMFEEIVGTSDVLRAVLSSIAKVAPTDSTVFITGETGTGKELIARAVHKRSRRSGRAFVSVNCAALAPSLISSELFGHEKGAFTGATQRRLGRFELADGGTIFLDEVGELPPDTQVALLRVLQEREFERVGGTQSIKVDVRVIAATNRNLKAAVAGGNFREDLFYRLNVFPIEVPPLRERRDDIPMLVEYFVQRYAKRAGKNIRSIDKKTLELLRSYRWPGNIRELQNIIERSVILCYGEVFSVDESWFSKESSEVVSQVPAPQQRIKRESSGEREIIEAALAESRGRVAGPSGAAAKLRIPSSTLESRIKVLKIRKSDFKFG
jgi:PAS domain S-box-containing protein